MKKMSLILSAIFLLLAFTKPQTAIFADNSPSTSRFEFIEVAYDGEIHDANKMSQDFFMVCANNFKNGYIDKNGKVVIDFSFSYAGSFEDGLAPASVPYGKFGYIDKTGKFVIEPQFDEANDFSSSLALVRKGNKTGFIDKTGKFVDIIKDKAYTPVSSYNDGVCFVQNEYEQRAVVNADGRFVTGFDFVWSSEFSDGVCWVSKDAGDDFKHINMGLIDTNGKFLIEPGKYTDGGFFSEGVCWARKTDSDKIFLIDKNGNEITSIDGSLMPSSFSGGICVNIGGDLLSIMNTQGVTVYSSNKYLPVHYGGFNEGSLVVRRKEDGKYFIMRDNNYTKKECEETITKYSYEPVENIDTSFEISLMVNTNTALVNGQKMLIDPSNSNVCAFVLNSRTLLPMRFIAENLPGYSVTWDYISNSALIQSSHISILLAPENSNAEIIRYVPENRFYTNQTILLEQPPINAYDRLFLPVRALFDMVGINVFYDERGLVVLSNKRTSLDYNSASNIIDSLIY